MSGWDEREIRHRLRWWRLPNLCRRFVNHWWRELEPGVRRCRLCRSTLFDNATEDQLHRYLIGGSRGEA